MQAQYKERGHDMTNEVVDFTSQKASEQVQEKKTSQTEMLVERQAQEVQVAMIAAKRFPRNQVTAYNNILTACQRVKLAETSMYEFPRGKEIVTGHLSD